MKYLLIIFSIVLVSCTGQKKAAMDEHQNITSQDENRIELLMSEQQGMFDEDEILVIKDAKRLKSFFSEINKTRKPGLPLPDIDFSKDMLIVQCVGEKRYDDFVKFSRLEETETQLILKTSETIAEKNSSKAIGHSSFRIYKIPLTEKEVILETGIK